MPASSAPARLSARHVQLARALFAAIAAIMVTFTPDHSAPIGLAVFSGFGIATALVLALSAWLVADSGRRALPIVLALLYIVAGMVAGVTSARSTVLYFSVVIAWGVIAGGVELIAGIVQRRRGERVFSRDAIAVGGLTAALGIVTALVPAGYTLRYSIEGAGDFTLTGAGIAVGILGGYAAITAVYLAIAGFSPTPKAPDAAGPPDPALAAEGPVARPTSGTAALPAPGNGVAGNAAGRATDARPDSADAAIRGDAASGTEAPTVRSASTDAADRGEVRP